MNLQRNLTLLMDFYQLTMSGGYFASAYKDTICVFEMFFRKNPEKAGFSIVAGLEQVITYLENLHFSPEDIEFLKGKNLFSSEFLSYLSTFQFSCDVWAVKEGTPVFPKEPIFVVKGPVIQGQLIETMVLLTINHQSLIATKTNRIVRAAQGRQVLEFGSRRAQGYDGAIFGARAAYIGGADATACTLAEQKFSIPAVGTMAHSWVQLFPSEYLAFHRYATTYPHQCTLLVDTYNTLSSGIPNAIRVFEEVLLPQNIRPFAIRIDSGDLAYISKKARALLDQAGFSDVKIILSNALDEYLIRDLLLQGASVDLFGVGENLITSKQDPVFGGVYKLVAVESEGVFIPKIKLSETLEKITTPHFKMAYRIKQRDTHQAMADYITLFEESVSSLSQLTIFDANATWKRKTLKNIYLEPLLIPIFSKGKLVYSPPSMKEIREHAQKEGALLWDEVKRFENPHTYYVDLSPKLFQSKQDLLEQMEKQWER